MGISHSYRSDELIRQRDGLQHYVLLYFAVCVFVCFVTGGDSHRQVVGCSFAGYLGLSPNQRSWFELNNRRSRSYI